MNIHAIFVALLVLLWPTFTGFLSTVVHILNGAWTPEKVVLLLGSSTWGGKLLRFLTHYGVNPVYVLHVSQGKIESVLVKKIAEAPVPPVG